LNGGGMGKPWGRYEIGFIDHPKFLALTANAICLWWEGKHYCDKHLTDGLIPREALKLFRFSGRKSVDMLLTPTTTPKPDGSPYAALWERHAVGFKMHDFLDHNDCRDAVMERMDKAENRRQADRDRKADWRARKAGMSHGTNSGTTAGQMGHVPASVPPKVRSTTEALTETQTERASKTAASPRALAREPNPNGNYRVIEKIAIEALGEESFDSESDFAAAVKALCAQRAIAYGPPDEDADVVARACASAKVKRVMSRKPH
jgi:hypothetical protein